MHSLQVCSKLTAGALIGAHDQNCTIRVVLYDWIEIGVTLNLIENLGEKTPFWLLFKNGSKRLW